MTAKVFILRQSLLLASASPRRKDLLASVGIDCPVYPAAIDETRRRREASEGYVRRMAEEKALAVARRFPESYVLAADTVVARGTYLLGKPASVQEAARMLTELSGKTHRVLTAYCISQVSSGLHILEHVTSKVRFADWDAATIAAYAACGEPLDKAGAYGIQGAGAFLVAGVVGSSTNVIGLPLAEVIRHFLDLGVVVPAGTP
ncbi:MAG: Maf family protein [Desulfobulbaceae bacterium]|jgi:septum formation protein|nr:Maf family protein [Desulfobulbaceae bacterium]